MHAGHTRPDPARLTARAERLYVLHAGSALREGTARRPSRRRVSRGLARP
ncbi:MAG: hypothetical protein WDM96_00085 [Lacunisphaera sp.]